MRDFIGRSSNTGLSNKIRNTVLSVDRVLNERPVCNIFCCCFFVIKKKKKNYNSVRKIINLYNNIVNVNAITNK